MSDALKFWVPLIVTVVVLFVGVGALMITANEYQCNKYHEATGRETKLVAQTCFTKVQGEWYPVNQVRAIQ
jgi:hypothetical protein